jgi:hypothetical protein
MFCPVAVNAAITVLLHETPNHLQKASTKFHSLQLVLSG